MQNVESFRAHCRICLEGTAESKVCLLIDTILPKINAGFAYESITGLKIISNDGLSNCICKRCERRLRDAFLLRQLAEKSTKTMTIDRRAPVNDAHQIHMSAEQLVIERKIARAQWLNDMCKESWEKYQKLKLQARHAKRAEKKSGKMCKKIYFTDGGEVKEVISSDENSDATELEQDRQKESTNSIVRNENPGNLRIMTREDLHCPENERRDNIVANSFQKNKLQDDNIGYKMLQNLGWSGGSLGKNSDGIEEPVQVEIKRNRHCLGLNRPDIRTHYGYQDLFVFMRTYKNSRDSNYDMEFADKFSDKEKNHIYGVCRRLKLHATKLADESGQYALRVSKMTH